MNLNNFNYEGKRREIFKFKPNNKRDLVFSALYYRDKDKWKQHKETTIQTLSINKSGIPNAKKILAVYGEEPEKDLIN